MSQLNTQIKEAIDSFDMDKARSLLRDALKEADAETYFLASKVALDDEQRREFLDKAIQLDPFHEKARNALKANGTSASPASNQSAPVPPAPQTSFSDLPALEALVASDTTLYTLPVESSLVITQLRKETKVYPFERDDYGDWYQVLYPSPLGKKIGWLKATNAQAMLLNNEEVPGIGIELPITNFEGYSRNDVQSALTEAKKHKPTAGKLWIKPASPIEWFWDVIAVVGAIIFLGICIGWFYFTFMLPYTTENYLLRSQVSPVLSFSCFVLPLIIIFASSMSANSSKEYKTLIQKTKDFNTKLKRWDGIQKGMRSEYEVMRDDQRWNFFMNSALNLGSNLATTAASRYIPDRKEITLKEKRGK